MRERLRELASLLLVLLVAFPAFSQTSDCQRLEAARQRARELQDQVDNAEMLSEETSARLDEARDVAAQAPNNLFAIQQAEYDIDDVRTRLAVSEREVQVAEYEAAPARLAMAESRLSAQRLARDAARDALKSAQTLRANIDAQPAVVSARKRVSELHGSIRSIVGAAAVVDPTNVLRTKLGEDYEGEAYSSLWASYRVLERTKLTSDVLSTSDGGYIDQHSDKNTLLVGEREALKLIDGKRNTVLRYLGELGAANVAQAASERSAASGLTGQQRDALSRITSLELALKLAEDDLTVTQEARDSAASGVKLAQENLPELRHELDGIRQELTAAQSALDSERAKTSPEQERVEELTQRLAAADDEFYTATDRLVRVELQVEGLQEQLAKVEAEVKQRVAEGNALGSRGIQAGRDGDQALCLQQLDAARQQFSVAYALASGNVNCVSGLQGLIGRIESRLNRTERAQCNGQRLDPDPRDGLVAVPTVVHLSLPKARQSIQAAGLSVAAVEYLAPPDTASAGVVSRQDPVPAERVEAGATVTVWHYGNLRTVPAVSGMTVDEADSLLAQNGLFGNRAAGQPAPTPDLVGSVYDQSPGAQSQVLPGESVQITFYTDPAAGGASSGFTASGPPSGATTSSSTSGSSGTGPSGFTASGQPTTVGGSTTGSGQPPAPVANPARDAAVRRIQQAWAACDLNRALQLADFLVAEFPADPWIAGNYGRLIDQKRAGDATRTMLQRAQAYLGKPKPSATDIANAVQVTQRAQSMAPSCMSQSISGLGPQIAAATQAIRTANAADAAARRRASGGFASALTGVLAAVGGISGVIPPDIASEVAGLTGMTSTSTAALGELTEALGLAPSNSSPSARGTPTGGGATAGSSGGSAATKCNVCFTVDYTQLGAPGRLNYVFGSTAEFPAPSCPGGKGKAQSYMILGISPEDDEGRPLGTWAGAATYARTVPNTRIICGPCGTPSQTRSVLRRHCPNPSIDTQGLVQRFPQLRR